MIKSYCNGYYLSENMLYSHDDINNNNNNNNTGGLCRSCYEMPSALGDTRRENMLISPPRAVHLVVCKISTHLCRSRPKLIWLDQILKIQLLLSTVVFQLSVFFCFFFKILKFSGHFFQAWRYLPTQFTPTAHGTPFSGTLWWQMMIIISFPRRLASKPSDFDTWNKRHRVVQNLTKQNEI